MEPLLPTYVVKRPDADETKTVVLRGGPSSGKTMLAIHIARTYTPAYQTRCVVADLPGTKAYFGQALPTFVYFEDLLKCLAYVLSEKHPFLLVVDSDFGGHIEHINDFRTSFPTCANTVVLSSQVGEGREEANTVFWMNHRKYQNTIDQYRAIVRDNTGGEFRYDVPTLEFSTEASL